LYEQGIRKYGFHGTSHDYVTRQAATVLGKSREELKIISLHLGNGASATAVKHGKSTDTTMGLTPLDGLLMGTRTGEIDPGVLLHLLRNGSSLSDLDTMLNKQSGLLGLSGVSNDMRDVRGAASSGNAQAKEALEVFCYRITKIIGSYAAAMGGLDAIVFTGGIGENDAQTRAESLTGLEFLGVELDAAKNQANETVISTDSSRVKVLVIRTDEEAMMAELAERQIKEERGERKGEN
jgi:acetate kinase